MLIKEAKDISNLLGPPNPPETENRRRTYFGEVLQKHLAILKKLALEKHSPENFGG
jgi:hypothetical protein